MVVGELEDLTPSVPTGHLGEHDHLNQDGIPLKLDVNILASIIVREDYGFVRMLTALCRANRKRWTELGYNMEPKSMLGGLPLTSKIESEISKGLWL